MGRPRLLLTGVTRSPLVLFWVSNRCADSVRGLSHQVHLYLLTEGHRLLDRTRGESRPSILAALPPTSKLDFIVPRPRAAPRTPLLPPLRSHPDRSSISGRARSSRIEKGLPR